MCGSGEITLEVEQIGNAVKVSDILLDGARVKTETYLTQANEYTVVGLKAYLAKQVLDRIEIKYPLNWWEAVKERFFPKVLLNHFPVVYVIRTMEAKVYYPQIAVPKYGNKIRLSVCP